MPSSKHVIEVDASVGEVWNFVKDLNNWAPLMPGYTSHEVINEDEGTWEFFGDFGIVKKKIKLKVDQIVRVEPNSITFDLKGLNESVEGEGKFEVVAKGDHSAQLTGYLDISGGGFMGGMINSVLKTFVPESTNQLVDSIGEKVVKMQRI